MIDLMFRLWWKARRALVLAYNSAAWQSSVATVNGVCLPDMVAAQQVDQPYSVTRIGTAPSPHRCVTDRALRT